MIKKYYPDIEETLYESTLQSGMRVLILPKPGFAKTEVELAVRFGSLDVSATKVSPLQKIDFPQGIAHFIEHLLFESEETNPTAHFARIGAAVNAYTTYDKTTYYFSTTNGAAAGIKLLLDMVLKPRFDAKSVQKEAEIIAQEIMMYEDDFEQMIYNDLIGKLYWEHPIRNDIAGTVDSVKATDIKTLLEAYELFYHPHNLYMVIVGDVDAEALLELLETETQKYPAKPWNLSERGVVSEPIHLQTPSETLHKDISVPMLMMGLRLNLPTATSAMESALSDVKLSFLMGGIFGKGGKPYQSLMKKHLINDSFDFFSNIEKTYGHVIFFTETKRPQATLEAITAELKKLMASDPDKTQFLLAKRKMIGEYLQVYNNVSHLANFLLEYLMKDINLFDFFFALGRMEYDEMAKIRETIVIDSLCAMNYHPQR